MRRLFSLLPILPLALSLPLFGISSALHPTRACAITDGPAVTVSGSPDFFGDAFRTQNMKCWDTASDPYGIKETSIDVTDVPVTAVCLQQTSGVCTDGIFDAANSNGWYARFTTHLDPSHIIRDQGDQCYIGCATITPSAWDSNPGHFTAKMWAMSLKWMPDANNAIAANASTNDLYAFFHNEYHGELYTDPVRSLGCDPEVRVPETIPPGYTIGYYRPCWYASVTTAKVSLDSNRTPTGITWPASNTGLFRHVIAAPGRPYADGLLRMGIYKPKVIWGWHESNASQLRHMWLFASAADRDMEYVNIDPETDSDTTDIPAQTVGQCLFRKNTATNNLWKAWDTTSPYTKVLGASNAYDSQVDTSWRRTDSSYCKHVMEGDISSIVWVNSQNRYLALFDQVQADTVTRCIEYAWSDVNSITDWNAHHNLLCNLDVSTAAAAKGKYARVYYSMIDPDATDVNYETVHDQTGAGHNSTANLYFTAIHYRDQNPDDAVPPVLDGAHRDLDYYAAGLIIHDHD